MELLRKHGIDFVDLPALFAGEILTIEDTRYSYSEQRFITFGLLQGRGLLSFTPNVRIAFVLFQPERPLSMNNESSSNRSQTDWRRLDAMSDEDIDFSDCPEVTPEMFANAVVRKGLPVAEKKTPVILRIDSDVLDWFKSQGQSYQAQINALLRAYMEANQ